MARSGTPRLLPGAAGESPVRVLGRLLMGAQPQPGVPWEEVVRLARRYGVASLLYYRLWEAGRREGEAAGSAPPQRVRHALRGDYHALVARRMAAERQLGRILEAMAAAGIPALVLKGPVVARSYPHPALRAYNDLDLLVPVARLEQAEEALQDLGYRAISPVPRAPEEHRHLMPMRADQEPLMVELHHRLDEPGAMGRLPVEDLWGRALPWSVEAQPALRLEAIDAVLHQCQHAVVQNMGLWYLRSVLDLSMMTVDWGQSEWEVLARRAIDWDLGRAVVLMLVLAEQVLGTTAPREALAALAPDGSQPLPEDLAERLLAMDGQRLATIAFAMRAERQEPPLVLARRLWRKAYRTREEMAAWYGVPAGSPRIWLAYVRRSVELLRRFGPTVWRRLWRRPSARLAWDQAAWLQRWLHGGPE